MALTRTVSAHTPGVTSVAAFLAVTLFLPRIAVIVVPVAFPESGPITTQELEPGHPLGALPEVQVGKEQPQRPAVLWTDQLTVAPVDQHVFGTQEILQREIGRIALRGVHEHVRGARSDLG